MICPCCGQPVTPGREIESVTAMFRGLQLAILNALISAREPMSGDDLAERVYAGVLGGGPEDAVGVVRTCIARMRPRLREAGWAIPVAGKLGYRLDYGPSSAPPVDKQEKKVEGRVV